MKYKRLRFQRIGVRVISSPEPYRPPPEPPPPEPPPQPPETDYVAEAYRTYAIFYSPKYDRYYYRYVKDGVELRSVMYVSKEAAKAAIDKLLGIDIPIPPPPTGDKALFNGINYTWANWEYNIPDSTLDKHFSTFRSLGVQWISIASHWIRLEPQKGIYNNTYLADMARVAKKAGEHGLSVMLDNHTMSYAMPSWCKTLDFMCSDLANSSAYVEMSKVLTQNVPCAIFAPANEPTNGGLRLKKDDALTTWERIRAAIGKPITIRLDYPSYNLLKGTRLSNICDCISLNYYPKYVSQTQLQEIKDYSAQKPLWITETGYESTYDGLQKAGYGDLKITLDKFYPTVVMPWIWEHPISGPATLSWNLCKNVDGQPRSAMLA